SLVLLALLPTCERPLPVSTKKKYKTPIHQFFACLFGKLGKRYNEDSAFDQAGLVDIVTQDRCHRIHDVCAHMTRQLCLANKVRQVDTQVQVIADAQMGCVASNVKELGATSWVVLDGRLKKEGDCCLKQLNCNIVLVDQAIPKVLRSVNTFPMKRINAGIFQDDDSIPSVVEMLGDETDEVMTWENRMKLGDFGLARWQANGQSAEETRVIGAFGYLAPEYTQTALITEKADVYAFGIVLLELVSGLKATDLSRDKDQQYLPEWARMLFENKICLNEIIDPRLQGCYSENEVESMMFAASLCISPRPERRPRMLKVLRLLEGDIPIDIASPYREPMSTWSEQHPKDSYKVDRSIIQSPSGMNEPMHHRSNSYCSNMKPTTSSNMYVMEGLENSISANQSEQSVSEEYQIYLQGSLADYIQKMY
ncbi:hypothetical protein GIB67_036256, partial [Kingdonia uniflora]